MSRLTDYEGAYCFMRCVEEDGDEDKIRENCKLYKACFERKMYDKLKHYEDLEEAGRLIEVERCKDCIRHENSSIEEGYGWCDEHERITGDDDYCSYAISKFEVKAKLAELKEGDCDD